MKTKILSIAFLLSSVFATAQNYADRPFEPFNKIEIIGATKVYYTQSDTMRLRIVGDEKQQTFVETKVEKGTLIISTKGHNETLPTVYIHNNSVINGVSCLGASVFKTVNTIKSDSLLFNVTGAAVIDAKVDAKKVFADATGASNVKLSGLTDNFNVTITGASILKSYDLVSKNTNINASGASSAKIYVTTKLNAQASGASSVKVKGEVKDINAETTSAASISRILETGDAKISKDGKGDSTTINLGHRKVIIISGDDEKKKTWSNSSDFDHWAGFAVGVNGLLTPDATTTLDKRYSYLDLNYSRCINFQLNLFQHNFHLYKNYVNLVTGFGIEWRRYMLDNKTTLKPDSSFTWGTIDSTNTYKYNKNLFKSTLLQVPLLLEFNTSKRPSKSFHIAVGAVGQFMINSKTKQKLESNGNEFTKINKDTYNLNTVNVKAHASIGYSNFTVFGEYNITPLFQKGEGPQVYPFVAGVRLIGF